MSMTSLFIINTIRATQPTRQNSKTTKRPTKCLVLMTQPRDKKPIAGLRTGAFERFSIASPCFVTIGSLTALVWQNARQKRNRRFRVYPAFCCSHLPARPSRCTPEPSSQRLECFAKTSALSIEVTFLWLQPLAAVNGWNCGFGWCRHSGRKNH